MTFRRRSGRAGGPLGTESAAGREPSDPAALARSVCLRLLTGSPRTRAQLEEALRRRGIPADVASEVLDRYTEVGLLDDAAFAGAWVQSRHAGRGLARRALSHELRQRGVSEDVLAEAVSGVRDEDESSTALRLAARRLAATASQPTEVRVRRTAGFLARKGYSGAVAMTAVRAALAAERVPAVVVDVLAPEHDPDADDL